MNLSIKQKQNHGHREQTGATKGGRVGGVRDWDVGVRCKLLDAQRINSKALLYSTEICIQYPTKKHNGKDYKNVNIYTYIYA